ncbi:RHG26 protein, partial [Polypterus senegalus]
MSSSPVEFWEHSCVALPNCCAGGGGGVKGMIAVEWQLKNAVRHPEKMQPRLKYWPGVITMQALSEEDRRLWMEAMDGREPVYNSNKDNQNEGTAQLDSTGFTIIKKFIHAVESQGICEQGLYRIGGVSSRVQKLLTLLMDSKTAGEVDLDNRSEWEIKTITSALKHYLRVSKHHEKNLMTTANLGVVFGPTLLRPQEETVAAIMDIKFQNIVVEILIDNCEKIFNTVPESALTNSQLISSRRRSTECKPPSCSERPLTLFHANSSTEKSDKGESTLNSSAESIITMASFNSSNIKQNLNNFNCSDPDLDVMTGKNSRPNSLLNPKHRSSVPISPTSPSPTSPRSPSWPMFSAPSSPQQASSSDSSPVSKDSLNTLIHFSLRCCSPTVKKARALYACKAEHDSELSFSAGTIFDNAPRLLFPRVAPPYDCYIAVGLMAWVLKALDGGEGRVTVLSG